VCRGRGRFLTRKGEALSLCSYMISSLYVAQRDIGWGEFLCCDLKSGDMGVGEKDGKR